jgi:hypothetical protein
MPPDATDQREESAPNLSALALTLRQSCIELMADYGVCVTPQKWRIEAAESNTELIAEVDFKGRLLYGSVVLSATRGVILEAANGAAGMRAKVPRSLTDWNRELVNQLLGRVKNKLRTQEVSVDVGVPRPLVHEPAGDYQVCQRFSSAAGTFTLFLVAVFDAGLVLGAGSLDDGLPSEGELLLF